MIEEESVTKMRRKNYKKILHWGIKRGKEEDFLTGEVILLTPESENTTSNP